MWREKATSGMVSAVVVEVDLRKCLVPQFRPRRRRHPQDLRWKTAPNGPDGCGLFALPCPRWETYAMRGGDYALFACRLLTRLLRQGGGVNKQCEYAAKMKEIYRLGPPVNNERKARAKVLIPRYGNEVCLPCYFIFFFCLIRSGMRDTAGARNPKTSACLQFLPHIYIDTYLFLHIYNTSHIEEKRKNRLQGLHQVAPRLH